MTALSNSYKISIITVLITGCVVLTYCFQVMLHEEVVYTHFYYIPIIMACFWWKKKGLVVPVFFTAVLLFRHLYDIRIDVDLTHDIFRAFMFLVIGVVVSLLGERLGNSERKLREGNDFHQLVLNSLAYPFYVLDAHDYSIKISNLEAHYGMALPEKATCHEITHKSSVPCATEAHQCPVREVKRTGKPQKIEHLHYDKDGKPIHVEVYAYPVFDGKGDISQIIEYSIDIRERRKLENAVRESRENYRKLFEEAIDAMFLADVRTGILLDCNLAAAGILERDKREIIGKHESFLFPRDDMVDGFSRTFTTHATSDPRRLIESQIQIVTKSGCMKQVAIRASRMVLTDREVILGIFRDITELKQVESEREKLIAELQDALANVKQLSGMLPICLMCKKIRDDQGYWEEVATYITKHSDIYFSHGLCPDCARKSQDEIDEYVKNRQSALDDPESKFPSGGRDPK